MKKDYIKYKFWLKKKGNHITLFCYEFNIDDICHNTWWIYSDSTIHILNTLQYFLDHKRPIGSEHCIYIGNRVRSPVEAIGTCNIILNCGFILYLKKTFSIPNFSRNLILVSRLVPSRYSFHFSDLLCNIFNKFELVGNGTLCDGLYWINLQDGTIYSATHIQNKAGIKRSVIDESSSILWHWRLGLIFLDKIKRLANEEVLKTPDFTGL